MRLLSSKRACFAAGDTRVLGLPLRVPANLHVLFPSQLVSGPQKIQEVLISEQQRRRLPWSSYKARWWQTRLGG